MKYICEEPKKNLTKKTRRVQILVLFSFRGVHGARVRDTAVCCLLSVSAVTGVAIYDTAIRYDSEYALLRMHTNTRMGYNGGIVSAEPPRCHYLA